MSAFSEKSVDLKILGDILKSEGEDVEVTVHGWVHRYRDQKKIKFIILRDGTAFLQVVLLKDLIQAKQSEIDRLRKEVSIKITGTIHTDARAPEGYEMTAKDIEVIGDAPAITSIGKDTTLFKKLEERHLVLREERLTYVMKIRHYITKFLRDFFYEKDLFEVTPPTITQQEVEGGSTLFKMPYYDDEVCMTQSSQLYLETVIPSMKRVFCILPSYRAEKSKTRRHLTEFTHVEAELAFIEFEDLLQFIEDMMCYVTQSLYSSDECRKMLSALYKIQGLTDEFKPLKGPFRRIRYSEVIKMLKEMEIYKDDDAKTFYEYGEDIPEKPERELVDRLGEPVFLTHFPAGMKAFYMERASDVSDETLSVDLLLPHVGEVVGGSMRLIDFEGLIEGFKREGISTEKYSWYIDQRKYGSVPHGGFGLGLERIVLSICKQDTVRDCSLYPRYFGRCYP